MANDNFAFSAPIVSPKIPAGAFLIVGNCVWSWLLSHTLTVHANCLPQGRIDPDRRRRAAGFFFQTLDLVVQHVDFPLQLGFTPGIH